MSVIKTRILNHLAKQPATRTELSEACFATKSSVHKLCQKMLKDGEIRTNGHKYMTGWRNGKIPANIYELNS